MSSCLSLLQGFPEGHPSLQPPRACHLGKGRDKHDTHEPCGPWDVSSHQDVLSRSTHIQGGMLEKMKVSKQLF